MDQRHHPQRLGGSERDLALGLVLRIGTSSVLCLRLQTARGGMPTALPEFIGRAASVQDLRRKVDRYAGVDDPVLILGSTGTGKELVARAFISKDAVPAVPSKR